MKSSKTHRSSGSFLLDYSAVSSPSRRSLRRHRAAASSVHVVIVATHADSSFMPLLCGCAILDVNVRVIGWKEKLHGPREGWRARKILELCEELEEDEVVVVLDSFYGLALQHKEVILDKFKEFRGSIVCMTSKAPTDREKRSFFTSCGGRKVDKDAGDSRLPVTVNGSGPGLHAGAFIGYAGTIARVLAQARQEDTCVQALFSSLYRGEPNKIVTIDVNCSIFHQCHSSSSIRILSYEEAHAVAVHLSPQFSTKSPPPNAEPSSLHPSSHPCLPHSLSRPKSSFTNSFSSPISLGSECGSSCFREPTATITAPCQQQCVTRPAPYFRPSPLQKIAMDATTGETPCFLHFSDGGCAAAILRKLEFFIHSEHHLPQQGHYQEQLQQQRHSQLQSLPQNDPYYCGWLLYSSSGRNCCCFRRVPGGTRHGYPACSILRAFLYIFLLVVGAFGIHTCLARSCFYGLLPETFTATCDSLLQIAKTAASTVIACSVVPTVQAFNYIKNITTLWLSVFLSCCGVGLCGAACCGSYKGAEEHNFHRWQKDYDEQEVGVKATAPLIYDEQRQQLDKCMQADSQQKKQTGRQQQAVAPERSRLEEDIPFSVESEAKERSPVAVQPRKRSCSSRRHKREQHQDSGGVKQQLQQQDSNQQLLSPKMQQEKQIQQKQQAGQHQDLPQPFQEQRLKSSQQQHRRSLRSVSRTRATRAQRSTLDVNSQRRKQEKAHDSSDTATGALPLTPPPPLSPRVATRQTRASTRIAAALIASAGESVSPQNFHITAQLQNSATRARR